MLTMMSNIYIFVFCFTAYIPIATTETVWVKDVTTRLQREKRSIDVLDLPEKMSFILKRNSNSLTLNLKRNYLVDPNSDIYTMINLNDGRASLEKTVDVEKENIAYYQDRENGAFMAARCVKKSNGQCDILINGNINIGDKNYDLQPSKDDLASTNVLENTDLLGKRYVLQDQSNIETDIPYIQDLSYIERDRPVLPDQLYIETNQEFQQDEGNNQIDVVVERKDNLKTEYTVKVVVVLDSSVWDLFLSLVNTSLDNITKETKAEKNIRRYFSYIMNGVDQLYSGINDPNIEIHVKMCGFFVGKLQEDFAHRLSQVHFFDGFSFINASAYLDDLFNMDRSGAFRRIPEYDQVILFTRHTMYLTDMSWQIGGISYPSRICVPGYRVEIVHLTDYYRTTSTAAHELGHSLGAVHDGDDTARGCKAEDGFIMAPKLEDFVPYKPYSRNPWIFSTCSVEAFKRTIVRNPNLIKKPVFTQPEIDEWNKIMAKLPGQKYSPSVQCQFIIGPGSSNCGMQPERRCRFMHCKNPLTGLCIGVYYSAAPGTVCGMNKWCQQGECLYIRRT